MIPADVERACTEGLQALNAGREDEAIPALERATQAAPTHKKAWQVLGLLFRAAGDSEGAVRAFDRAAALAPNDARVALGRAYAYLEAGLPALALFEAAKRAGSGDPAIGLGEASARLAEQGAERTIAALEAQLAMAPLWVAGHWLLARLLWAQGRRAQFTTSFEKALTLHPRDLNLWAHLLFALMHAQQPEAALDAITRGRAVAGAHPVFDGTEAAALSETGAYGKADWAFARLTASGDLATAIQHVRHLLRSSRPEAAIALAEPFAVSAAAHMMYPYIGLAWRLTGDPRWAWLEGDERFIGVYDIAADLPSLGTLAERLRGLHWAAGQPLEQSLRGGTQTDGPLLARLEPEIRHLKQAIEAAVRAHIDRMPPPDSRHPLLGLRRDRPVRYAGSWSVRLQSGHHANHVHPDGWISSVLYVSLPENAVLQEPAGWLTLGAPDDRLGVALQPFRTVQPKPGRLVLFPSTTWHGTVPFTSGERLTVAFDVARPR